MIEAGDCLSFLSSLLSRCCPLSQREWISRYVPQLPVSCCLSFHLLQLSVIIPMERPATRMYPATQMQKTVYAALTTGLAYRTGYAEQPTALAS